MDIEKTLVGRGPPSVHEEHYRLSHVSCAPRDWLLMAGCCVALDSIQLGPRAWCRSIKYRMVNYDQCASAEEMTKIDFALRDGWMHEAGRVDLHGSNC